MFMTRPFRFGGDALHGYALRPLPLEGLDAPLSEVEPAWSPVVLFGGYHRTPSGIRQAHAFVEAALDSEEQKTWRRTRGGDVVDVHHHHDGPLGGCF